MREYDDCHGSSKNWSEAVCHVFQAELSDRQRVKGDFEELKRVVDDHATLIVSLYIEATRDEALDEVFSSGPCNMTPSFRRLVNIKQQL